MNLTSVIRTLETQFKTAQKLARQNSAKVISLQVKLAKVAKAIGQPVAALVSAGIKSAGGKRRGKMSAAGRRAIAEAQRKRWAKVKAKQGVKAKPAGAKRVVKMSAAGRRAIGAAQRARWAAYRKAKGK